MIEVTKREWLENIVNENEEILVSKKNAKEIVDIFKTFDSKKANKIDNCASTLVFKMDLDSGKRKLASANFCHDRFCPECSRRRSRIMYHNLKKVLTVAGTEYKQEFVHFTLSLKNCKKEELGKAISELFHGFITMMKREQFEFSINGWYRNLEITYNEEDDTFHPHIHIILAVDKDYFRKYSGKYLTQEFVTSEFRSACKIDYDPIVYLEKAYAKTKDGKKKKFTKEEKLHNIVAECSKYVTKISDVLNLENQDLKVDLLKILSKSLFKRRMTAYGKLLRTIFKQLQLEDEENADLLNVEGEDVVLGNNCIYGIFMYINSEKKYKLVKVLDNFIPAWKFAGERKRLIEKKEQDNVIELIVGTVDKTLKAYLS